MGTITEPAAKELSLEGLLDTAGSEGRYQWFLVIYTSFVSIAMTFSIFSLGFIYYFPDFYCFVSEEREKMKLCTEKEALNNPWGFRTFPSRTSLVTDYDLYGDRVSLYEWSQTFISVYTLLLTVALLLSIERIGRKWGYIIPLLLLAIGSAFNFFFEGPKMAVFGLGNICTGFEVYYCVSPTHINESIGGKLRSRATNIAFCLFALSAACFYLINMLFIGYEHIYLMIFLACIPGIIFFARVKESPSFELENQKFKELQKVLISISQENHDAPAHTIAVNKIVQELKPYIGTKTNKKDLLQEHLKTYGWRMLGATLIMGNLNFVYLTFSFSPQMIEGVGMCMTGVLLMIVEGIVSITMSFISPHSPRKLINIVCAALFIVAGGLLTFMRAYFRQAEIFLCLAIKFAMSVNFGIITTYVVELLPSELRTKTFLCIFLFGRILTTQIGRIISFSEKRDISPIPAIILPSIGALIAAIILPETLGKYFIN